MQSMDLFEAFPSLYDYKHQSLNNRSLRLISLSGLVYDDEALYFEFSPERYWGRQPGGNAIIGLGLPKVKPDGQKSPHKSLINYLHVNWRCRTALYPSSYTFLLDEMSNVSILPGEGNLFVLQLTPPRLGGVNIPDALVQAVILLPIQRFSWRLARIRTDVIKVARAGFTAFMENETWPLAELVQQSWCETKLIKPLPENAAVKMVLTLKGVRELLRTEKVCLDMLDGSQPN
jgi:hypothetical protein